LLWLDPYVDGMKTGHTESAGFCLITSARRGPRRLISVVLGTDSDNARTMESQKLLNYGFQFFDTVRMYAKDQAVATLPVWKGSEHQLRAGFRQDMYIAVPRGAYARLKASMTTTQPLLAPISAGQRVGTLKLSLDGKPYAEYALTALDSVQVGGIFSRTWDGLKLLFK
jgi:D-alanyl-D-alanine carboxypeptidase (penicillin-binding protein 5/6)